MNKKFYWIVSSIFLVFIAFFSWIMINNRKEIEQIKRDKSVADQIVDRRSSEKGQKTVSSNEQDKSEGTIIIDTPDSDLSTEDVMLTVDQKPTEESHEESQIISDKIDYDSVPGIPTLEDLTTTYKLKMAVYPDGSESMIPSHPIVSDYSTYEEYRLANAAWFKFMKHQSEVLMNIRNQK